MTIRSIIEKTFREKRRYTGDGLPGEPANAPLPIGDPQSGEHNPSKPEIREAFGSVGDIIDAGVQDAIDDARADTLATLAPVVQSVSDYAASALASKNAAAASADRIDLGDLDAGVQTTIAARDATIAARDASSASATLANTARIGAEAASDAAFVNAQVYPDVAAGLAATSVGGQFMVVAGNEIIRYRKDAGPISVEVARYSSASRIRSLTNSALEKFANIANLAGAKGGTYLNINPVFCFQEAAVRAVTPANVGDLVGCIQGAEGKLFAVAFNTSARGRLQQDAAGNYYIDAANSAYIIRDAAGVEWDPTVNWTAIGGWRGQGAAFTWSRDIGTRVNLTEVLNSGNVTEFYRFDNSRGQLLSEPHSSVGVPHVLRVVKTLADVSGFYNDNPQRGWPGPVAPSDDTDQVRQIGLFMSRSGPFNTSYPGRLYSFFIVSGALNDAETKIATAELMRVTIPSQTRHVVDVNPVILDFQGGSFQWNGKTRALSDMTDNGDGSYDLNYMNWWGQERTIVFDVETELAATSSGTFLEFLSENLANEVIEVDTTPPTNIRVVYRSNARNMVGIKDLWIISPRSKRIRCALIIGPKNRPVNLYLDSVLIGSNMQNLPGIPPFGVRIRPQLTGWKLTRAAFYGKALEGEELAAALTASASNTEIFHHIGDSFVGWNFSGFSNKLDTLISSDGMGMLISEDGVGGAAFFQTEGHGHSQRFAQSPLQWNKTLIINDGSFESSWGEALVKSSLFSIIEKLTHGINKRFIYLEPNPINPSGDFRNTDWLAATRYVKSMLGARYVETLEAMFCVYTNNADDIADVANGIWPRSTRSDVVHYLPVGQAVYAKAAYGAMKDLGFVAGTTALPGVVDGLVATGRTITWNPPTSDGGHPVSGYIVQINTGSWVTQTPQGSAPGYTKQYIRSWLAPAAGSYRVAAITRKGTGAFTEIVLA